MVLADAKETGLSLTAVSDHEDPSLNCGIGGIDLAVSPHDALWVLHAAAKQLIQYQAT